jgi:hypothetical protein
MAEEDYWSATIAAFQPLIDTPAITDKLLQRPPFRFIHDIIASIDRRFAAYNHLFTAEECDAAALDNKEKKIAYLDKLIAFIQLLLGRTVDVSTKKIVAGQEPERTNAFLRDVALAVGYAQQYKQQLAAQEAATQQAAAPPPPPPPPSDAPPPPPSQGGKPGLKIDATTRACPHKEQYLKEAIAFIQKVQQLGIALPSAEEAQRQPSNAISSSIRAMEVELKSRELPQTEPGKLTAPSLEIAIQRQLESIQQIKSLMDENSQICSQLIDATMSGF